MPKFDLLIKQAKLETKDNLVDVGVKDGEILNISTSIEDPGNTIIEAKGRLLSPPFVDLHKHPAKSFVAAESRLPDYYHHPFHDRDLSCLHREHTQNLSISEIQENILRNIRLAVTNGTLKMRAHVMVGMEGFKNDQMKNLKALLRSIDQVSHLIDIQVVVSVNVYDEDASLEDPAARDLFHRAIHECLDSGIKKSDLFVGQGDPASRQNCIDNPIRRWFEIAEHHDLDIDAHMQDGGSMGGRSLSRLSEITDEHGYQGRVTASHCFCLGHLPDWQVSKILKSLKSQQIDIVTCYQTIETNMPLRKLANSVNVAHGTDNDGDYVFPYVGADPLLGSIIIANKLQGEYQASEDYRWYETIEGLDLLWDLMTRKSATVFGCEGYGIEEGTSADFILFDAVSSHRAICDQVNKSYVIKNGAVVARDGELAVDIS